MAPSRYWRVPPVRSGGTKLMLERVRRLLADGNDIYECRNCGTTLGPHAEDCEMCGSADIACYTID